MKLILITLVAVVVGMMVACEAGQSDQKQSLKEAIKDTAQESIDNQAEREATYLSDIDPIADSYYANKAFYNSELLRIGEKVRSATDDQELQEAYEENIAMFEILVDKFRQDWSNLRLVLPAPRFKKFHFLLIDAINDVNESTQAFLTLYSMALNSGVADEDLASRASALHKSANKKSLEAGYMFYELCPKCD
jgi:hypothetical protein